MPNVGVYKARVKEVDQRTVVWSTGFVWRSSRAGRKSPIPRPSLVLKTRCVHGTLPQCVYDVRNGASLAAGTPPDDLFLVLEDTVVILKLSSMVGSTL